MSVRLLAAAALAAGFVVSPASAQTKTVRAVMHSDLKVLDPIWTTANIVRNHGYMVWDTLFAMDDKLQPRPQMVDKWELSADKLAYSFTLRDGLKWHDGKPVTSEDCIASIKRWGARDATGSKLMSFVAGFEAVDEKTFKLSLKEPYGLVIDSLAKPGGSTPLMMPKRIADTDPGKQISEFIGSGPFIFKTDEWKPGDRTVYIRNPNYKPRAEPPSGLAGGKVAKVDRVEWLAIPDHMTAVNALLAGEIDYIEAPPADGGWNGFMTAWLSVDMMNPLTNSMLTASCEKANFGWPCDSEVERLRDAYARAPDTASRQKIAADLQARAVQYGTHIHLGQYTLPTATRADRLSGVVTSPAPVFWGIEKK